MREWLNQVPTEWFTLPALFFLLIWSVVREWVVLGPAHRREIQQLREENHLLWEALSVRDAQVGKLLGEESTALSVVKSFRKEVGE